MANSFYEHSGYPPGTRARNSSQNLRNEFLAIEAGAQAIEEALDLKADAADLSETQAVLALKADAADLSEVDNTSDADKPISTLTQAALDLKADYSALVDFNPAIAGADKMLVTNATGDGWEYPAITAAGKALLDDASAAAQRATLGIGANTVKNLLINGGFDVWQRGTIFSTLDSSPFTADRWNSFANTNERIGVISRGEFLVGQTDVPGNPRYFLRMSSTNNDADFRISQRVEGLGRFSGENITLSFYAKGSIQLTGSVGIYAPSGTLLPILPTIVTGTTWTKHVVVFTVIDLSPFLLDADSYLEVRLRMHHYNGANFTCDIAQVQLEFGDTATDFEYRHPAEELALCQRYYETGTLRGPFAQYATNFAVGPQVSLLVEKRKTPLVTLSVLSSTGSDGTPGTLHSTNENTRGFNPVYNWTGGTIGRSFYGQANWTADAEL